MSPQTFGPLKVSAILLRAFSGFFFVCFFPKRTGNAQYLRASFLIFAKKYLRTPACVEVSTN